MVEEFFGIANWLNVQVVYEAGLAKEDSEQKVRGARDAHDGLESVGVDDLRVIDGG
jgi:hypothetical protein